MLPDSAAPSVHEGVYRQLDVGAKEIRLLDLRAAHVDEPIRCTLKHVSLSDEAIRESYETISYVWGDASNRSAIFIDGQEVDVPASSSSALRRMRRHDRDRVLWIDAVCINQADETERSNQVALMAVGYSSGAANLVWLGEDDGSTERVLSSIKLVLLEARSAITDEGQLTTEFYDGSGRPAWKAARVKADIDPEALNHFFSCRYWTRRWVVQEMALAPRSICHRGPHEIPLDPLAVHGHRISTVREVASIMTNETFDDAPHILLAMTEASAIVAAADRTAARNEILGLTLCAGSDTMRNLTRQGDATAAFADLEQYVVGHNDVPPWPWDLADSIVGPERRRAEYKAAMRYASLHRRVFRTTTGHLGLGPQIMRPDDVIAILAGCQWPVVLRPVDEVASEFRFIGTAYVYGMMFGEEVERLRAEGWSMEIMTLV